MTRGVVATGMMGHQHPPFVVIITLVFCVEDGHKKGPKDARGFDMCSRFCLSGRTLVLTREVAAITGCLMDVKFDVSLGCGDDWRLSEGKHWD